MSAQENQATLQKLGDSVNSGNFDTFDQIFSSDVVDHDPAPDQGSGPEGFKTFFTMMKTAFPDMKIAVDHVVSNDDNIAMAYTITGTHNGDFQGIAATGKSISARGMQIARFENGMIVERWGSSDELGIMNKLQS